MPKHTHKTPLKCTTARKIGWLCVRAVLGVFFVVLSVFFYKDKQAPHPLMVATTSTTAPTSTPQSSPHATLIIDSDDAYLPYLNAVITPFHRHHPHIRLHLRPIKSHDDQSPADFFFKTVDTASDNAVHFAIKEGQTLTAHFNKNSATALAFRDFLLSSTAQDLLSAHGMTSIEPYRTKTDPFKPTP
ncbi:MAG: hypothetical protein Q4B88_00905 [Moraxella sp.]|nr:hypothetical protein [Moraxella sp.]